MRHLQPLMVKREKKLEKAAFPSNENRTLLFYQKWWVDGKSEGWNSSEGIVEDPRKRQPMINYQEEIFMGQNLSG